MDEPLAFDRSRLTPAGCAKRRFGGLHGGIDHFRAGIADAGDLARGRRIEGRQGGFAAVLPGSVDEVGRRPVEELADLRRQA